MCYTLCLIWSPRTVKEGKLSRFNFQRKRDNDIMALSGKFMGIPEKDVHALKLLNSDFPSLERELLQQNDPECLCKYCELVKPRRAHHCSACAKCTMRMDHHCVWINACIGLDNYRFFVQLLFHTALSSNFTLYCIYLCSYYPFYVKQFLS